VLYVANRGVIPGGGEILAFTPIPEPWTYSAIAAPLVVAVVLRRRLRRGAEV